MSRPILDELIFFEGCSGLARLWTAFQTAGCFCRGGVLRFRGLLNPPNSALQGGKNAAIFCNKITGHYLVESALALLPVTILTSNTGGKVKTLCPDIPV